MKFKPSNKGQAPNLSVAADVIKRLRGACERVELNNTYRSAVPGEDALEIIVTPRVEVRRLGVFGRTPVDLAEEAAEQLVRAGFWRKCAQWDQALRVAVHAESGITVYLRTA